MRFYSYNTRTQIKSSPKICSRILIFRLVFVLTLLFPSISVAHVSAAEKNKNQLTEQYQLTSLTPEEKVGQLFLVTFAGSSLEEGSDIYNLITDYHVGGVILKRENNNFNSYSTLAEDARLLINSIQQTRYDFLTSGSTGQIRYNYIPLFSGLSQEGNQSDFTEIINGLSPVPSQMSIGATWDINLAEQIGFQVGSELSLLGVNLLLGPSLDILSDPSPSPSDLGVRSFGGDPYWVGEMGKSYIKGIHNGSRQNLAVIAKYFPGLGSADRLPDQEIATVRKSLEQLRQTDLAPFFTVTSASLEDPATADGLLNSHIRYQGLQGNIRATTSPISLDPQALDLLMSLSPLDTWRESGGVIVSDNLGALSIRQLYDPTGTSFDIRRVALDAFIAGNDILFLGNSGENNEPLPADEVAATIQFFAQKYREDEAFAERVDTSVERILGLKESLYPIPNLASVLTTPTPLANLEKTDTAAAVARRSATLIHPQQSDFEAALPDPPSASDRIVILTDTSSQKACQDCPDVTTLAAQDFENAILRLYGPLSGGQLVRANLTSYTYKEAITLLDFPSDMRHMETDLFNANWILVAAQDLDSSRSTSSAFVRLLSERQDLLRNKNLVVFSFGAPYYLDATNISKITAYYGLYNNLPSSIEIAARLLFQEIPSPEGNLPVSLPGIGYDLITATSPNPDQIFNLSVSRGAVLDDSTPQADLTPNPIFELNDLLNINTGIILDYNGNPVPDGTPIQFIKNILGEESIIADVVTTNGRASTNHLIDTAEDFEIHAKSLTSRSEIVRVNVLSGDEIDGVEAPELTINSPIPPTQSPSATTISEESPQQPIALNQVWRNWLLVILTSLAISIISYQAGAAFGLVRSGIRWGFSAFIAGMSTYIYLMLDLPGSGFFLSSTPPELSWILAASIGALSGWLIGFLLQKF
jgi:beta-N-acetylhexosaminidase